MDPNNYYNVEYSIGSILGGSNNTVHNTFQTSKAIFNNAGTGDAALRPGHHNLLSLELVGKYIEPLAKEVDSALCIGKYPLKIQITDLVADCANGTYYNDGNRDSEVTQLINELFTLICIPYNFNYQAKIAQVGPNYFFEMYPSN